VIEGARAAWTWRTIDQELAELVFDSAGELTGVRSEDTARQLTYSGCPRSKPMLGLRDENRPAFPISRSS